MGARWLALLAFALALVGVAACGGGDGRDPEDFATFADQIARAAEQGDTAFFTDRILGDTHVCTEEEVAGSTGPDAPPDPICLEVGFEFEAVVITGYPVTDNIRTPEVLARDIERLFEDALLGEEDQYGPGAVRLFATAKPSRSPDPGATLHTAIITAIHQFSDLSRRAARGLNFEYIEGRWMIRSEMAADFQLAVEMLEPSIAILVYEEWTAY